MTEEPGSILGGTYIILISITTRPPVGTTQFPIRLILGDFSQAVKRPKRKSDHSPISSGEVRNSWSYASTPHMFLWIWCLSYWLKLIPVHLRENTVLGRYFSAYLFRRPNNWIFYLVTCMGVAIGGFLCWRFDLLTTLTHDSWLHLNCSAIADLHTL
jgi:hypothetical protein